MEANINFRIFRRNNKNLILLWSTGSLSEEQREFTTAFSVEESKSRELRFSSFKPDNPEKFAPDVGGIVISHSMNNLRPSESCTIRVVLGSGDDALELAKDVLPANSVVESRTQDTVKRVHLYAMDYDQNEWAPLPLKGLEGFTGPVLFKERD